MADNQKVYQAIKTIADELCKENKTYLRADLAFELKKYGIASDSSEVSKLVFDAYRYFHDNGNIAIAFVSNNSRTTLVAEYKLNDSLEQGNKEEALKIAETELALSSSALEQLKEQVELNLNLVLAKGTSKMADIVMGTNGVKDVRSKASTMFDKYTKMVEAYHYAEDSVRGNIEDFTSLRSDIGTVYRDYALKLIDIYGDSIKMVSPDLFDFKRIEWLDVDEMLKYVELEYNKLTEKCAALIGEISVSFRTSLQGSLQACKSLSNGNKSLGLAMAGLTMLERYMGASERANRLKSDLSVFQMSVKHDATRIKADMGRLLVICKTLNDVVIPKANVFLRYGEKLLASDLKATLDALYADETIRPLEEQRKCLLQQMKALDMEMNDHLQNIDVYTSLINDITATLESKQGSYMEAKSKKPSKPFFLVNWITFGMANKNYYRDFAEWNAVCFPLVREYESYQVEFGKRIMILGESHYCDESCADCGDCLLHRECMNFTQQVLDDYLNENKERQNWMRTFLKFERSLVGEETKQAMRLKIWNSVVFFNYLQVAMGGPREAGTAEQYHQAGKAFFEVIEKYQPEYIIVWGKRLWNNLPNVGWQDGDDIVVDGYPVATGAYLLSNGKQVKVMAVNHPSVGYSWDYWHKVIQRFLR